MMVKERLRRIVKIVMLVQVLHSLTCNIFKGRKSVYEGPHTFIIYILFLIIFLYLSLSYLGYFSFLILLIHLSLYFSFSLDSFMCCCFFLLNITFFPSIFFFASLFLLISTFFSPLLPSFSKCIPSVCITKSR